MGANLEDLAAYQEATEKATELDLDGFIRWWWSNNYLFRLSVRAVLKEIMGVDPTYAHASLPLVDDTYRYLRKLARG